jgi:hypothetical protein
MDNKIKKKIKYIFSGPGYDILQAFLSLKNYSPDYPRAVKVKYSVLIPTNDIIHDASITVTNNILYINYNIPIKCRPEYMLTEKGMDTINGHGRKKYMSPRYAGIKKYISENIVMTAEKLGYEIKHNFMLD